MTKIEQLQVPDDLQDEPLVRRFLTELLQIIAEQQAEIVALQEALP